VTVDGTLNQNVDVTATFTRTDLIGQDLTQADLEKLVWSANGACLNYITVNSNTINYEIGNTAITATIPITVKGNAPSTGCQITVSDPQGIATPPINCEATFTITSTAVPECQIKSITPSTVRVGFGILPRIQRFVFTFNIDVEALGITPDDIKIDTPNATIFYTKISGNTITAWAVLSGLKPNSTYYFTVGECGTYSIDTKGFF